MVASIASEVYNIENDMYMRRIFSKIIHYSFMGGIGLKALSALGECLAGIAFIFITPPRFLSTIVYLTSGELAEDPTDKIANFLMHTAQHFSVSTEIFTSVYFLTHGIIRLAVAAALLEEWLWAFPLALVVEALFIIYQLYRFTYTHSLWLIFLTIFDVIIVVLIVLEYNQRKKIRRSGLAREVTA